LRAPPVTVQPPGFLGKLTAGERAELTSRGERMSFPRGSCLVSEGERTAAVIAILSGRVKVSARPPRHAPVMLAVAGPGDLVGELSAIDGGDRSASVTALEDTEALVLDAADFRVFVTSSQGVTRAFLELLAARLRDADRKRVELAAGDTMSRVSARLLELSGRFGEADPGGGLRIGVPLSQEDLAGWIGASQAALCTALADLRRHGWIHTARRSITVRDPEALRRRAALA
jgi:CRP-like cAMP-binding protein